jgi:hypothetical protein
MVNPTARIALFLGFIKGDRVNGWAQQQAETLSTRIFGEFDDQGNQIAPPTHFDDDEWLWTDMSRAFKRAYDHSTKEEDAFMKLQKCQMGNRTPDDYIAEFNELIRKAHWEDTAKGTIEMFKMGLPVTIHRRIMTRDQIPVTLGEWQEGLRREVERTRMIEASIGSWQPRGNISTRENLFRGILDPRTQPRGNYNRPRPRDPNAMDVDRVQTSGLSFEERRKLQAENKCFFCKEKGHMISDCLKRQGRQSTPRSNTGQFQSRNQGYQGGSNRGTTQPQRRPPQARPAKIREVVDDRDQPEEEDKKSEEPPPAYDAEKMEVQIRAMNTQDRQRLMEKFAFMEGF